MLQPVIPFNKKVVKLKPFTMQNALEFYYLGNDFKTIIKKLESFILTKDLNIVEKLYSLFYLRDSCVGSMINTPSAVIDADVFLREFDEILDINKKVKVDNIEVEFDYPYNFSSTILDETEIIKSVKVGLEKVYLNKLNNKDREVLINSLPSDIDKQLGLFVKEHANSLCIDVAIKSERLRLNYSSNTFVLFLKSIFSVVTPHSYREYIFSLSRRMHDITFLNNSTFVDIEDYLDLYITENKESKNTGDQALDGF